MFRNIILKKNRASLSCKRGFTMIELSLVVAIIILVGGLSAPIYQSFQVKNDLDVAALAVVQQIRMAQAFSRSVAEDSDWGVHLASGSVTFFKGSNYSTRDASFDDQFIISESVSFTGVTEIVFAKFSGNPNFSGSFVMSSINGESRNININQKGMIEY